MVSSNVVSRRDVLKGSSVAAGALGGLAWASSEVAGQSDGSGQNQDGLVASTLIVNGRTYRLAHEARITLLDLLREKLALPGTKKGCNEGACGACTVLLSGRRVNACMVLAAACEGSAITTVEGLANSDGTINAVQQAFIDHDAFQCGYCTPGQVVSAVACIDEGHAGSYEEIAEWMSGNLCRCAAYPQIVAAVRQAAEILGGTNPTAPVNQEG